MRHFIVSCMFLMLACGSGTGSDSGSDNSGSGGQSNSGAGGSGGMGGSNSTGGFAGSPNTGGSGGSSTGGSGGSDTGGSGGSGGSDTGGSGGSSTGGSGGSNGGGSGGSGGSDIDSGTGDDGGVVADGGSDATTDSGSSGDGGTGSDATVDAGPSCTLTQGYWSNHPSAWSKTSLLLGNTIYTEQQCLGFLAHPTNGDASLILSEQLITALLNGMDSGSVPNPNYSQSLVMNAEQWMRDNGTVLPYHVDATSPSGMVATGIASQLDQFNNGKVTGYPACQ